MVPPASLPRIYPEHMKGAADWCAIEADLCRKTERSFLDPEQTELELKEPKLYNQISTSYVPTLEKADAS